jgi:hypothetical protein
MGYLPTHAVGWIQILPISERDERPQAGVAFERFGQSIQFQDTAVAAWARVALIESYDVLSGRDWLVGRIRVEHMISPDELCYTWIQPKDTRLA